MYTYTAPKSNNLYASIPLISLRLLVIGRYWCLIANELGTGRTPLDCLSHYQQTVGHLEMVRNEPWTVKEGI